MAARRHWPFSAPLEDSEPWETPLGPQMPSRTLQPWFGGASVRCSRSWCSGSPTPRCFVSRSASFAGCGGFPAHSNKTLESTIKSPHESGTPCHRNQRLKPVPRRIRRRDACQWCAGPCPRPESSSAPCPWARRVRWRLQGPHLTEATSRHGLLTQQCRPYSQL